ncbi:hypothetical protein FGA82_13415 [Pseudomonas fluorescens]|jgi:hypothetical protein|uniref:hypothetical protein n=1 Tax=Pseudomonas fluorescens TaxID=294 RepID=UPI0011323A18|nr:hypothetical protein [Pseudomonas fluorescens]TMU79296.1 hypothetical protein FGA82_13415 [Pseudomonas fluorescens]
MEVQHQSSSDSKANTLINGDPHARHLMAIRIVGTALFDYQVRKTEVARIRLECLTTFAKELGDIDAAEFAVVAQLLAGSSTANLTPFDRPNSLEGIAL